jgi:phenylpyruvate tautomerase PptA (4-oxalocrotonate tautomerase family)
MPLLTVAMPFVICELFKDTGNRSRAIKGAAIAGAVAEEAAWALRNARREGEVVKRAATSAQAHML